MESRYCTFFVSDLLIGVEIERVQEVLREPEVTAVPLSDKCVLGLLNLRGQIASVIDARRRLGLAERGRGEPSAHVIIPSAGEPVCLVVDSEGEVVDVDEADFESVPETFSDDISSVISGIYKVDGKLLLVLDADHALSFAAA